MKISAVYLTKNEREFLPLSVATVLDDVDEVLIIDTKSTDGTLEIAKGLEAKHPSKVRVLQYEQDFDEACEFNCRNRAIAEVPDGDWLLMLDADQLLSDGWREAINPYLRKSHCESVAGRYEHLVGSYEYIHTIFYEKQHNHALHPEVPLWQTFAFKKTPGLFAKAIADENPKFRQEHHASLDGSVPVKRRMFCNGITLFHYGFAKRNMMFMAEYRIRRGDYTQKQEEVESMVKELHECSNPFRFITHVKRVDYGREFVPAVMRDAFDTTYRLDLDERGFIRSRVELATGEKL